jgi:hypothetical protein
MRGVPKDKPERELLKQKYWTERLWEVAPLVLAELKWYNSRRKTSN